MPNLRFAKLLKLSTDIQYAYLFRGIKFNLFDLQLSFNYYDYLQFYCHFNSKNNAYDYEITYDMQFDIIYSYDAIHEFSV